MTSPVQNLLIMDEALCEALRRDAIAAFQRAIRPGKEAHSHGNHDIVLAIDRDNQIVLEVLAYGAGGKQLYEELHITRLLSIDTAKMDAQTLRNQVALHNPHDGWPDHTIAFIIPPSPANAQLLQRALRPFLQNPNEIKCAVLWLPTATPECTLEMERQGLTGIVQQRNLALGLLPVDRNVASLCHDRVFAELYVHGKHHALTRVVQSILAIEKATGNSTGMDQITCHGAFAKRVKNMLAMVHELQAPPLPNSASGSGSFERLILIDRMEDPLSMLLTPMTYEGLLDAVIGMNHGVVSFEKPTSSEDTTSPPGTGKLKILLNHKDHLFSELRDVEINTVISTRLAEIAQQLVSEVRQGGGSSSTTSGTGSSSTTTPTTTTLAQVTSLLKKVPHLVQKKRSLANHLELVAQIQQRSQNHTLATCVETEMAILSNAMKRGLRLSSSSMSFQEKDVERVLEEALLRDHGDGDGDDASSHALDVYDVLKLLCLLSLVSGGLKYDKLQWYRQQLCHCYGYELLPLLVQLDKMELLSSSNKFDYQKRRKELSLMGDVSTTSSNTTAAPSSTTFGATGINSDIHFMFPSTGYAPMSVRLVQVSLGMKIKSTTSSSSSSSSSSTTTGSNTINHDSNTLKVNKLVIDAATLFGGGGRKTNILVYYLGGVTVAELAAYRFLNETQSEFHFFIATTALCNGERLLRGIIN